MMEFYERVSGARLHAAYVRPGGVALVNVQLSLYLHSKWIRNIMHKWIIVALKNHRISNFEYVGSKTFN